MLLDGKTRLELDEGATLESLEPVTLLMELLIDNDETELSELILSELSELILLELLELVEEELLDERDEELLLDELELLEESTLERLEELTLELLETGDDEITDDEVLLPELLGEELLLELFCELDGLEFTELLLELFCELDGLGFTELSTMVAELSPIIAAATNLSCVARKLLLLDSCVACADW